MQHGVRTLAHRIYYERAYGPIPHGFEVDHLCNQPGCVNPEHLEAVTPTENKRRSARTKLTLAAVQAIRASADPYAVLAERHGVTVSNIEKIRAGRYWHDRVPMEVGR